MSTDLEIHSSAYPTFCSSFDSLDIRTPLHSPNDLLNFNSSTVTITDSRLTEKDCNLFLKHWLLGISSQNLKLLTVCFLIDDKNALLDGIFYTQQPEPRAMGFESRRFDYRTIRGSFDVQNVDGVEATLYLYDFSFDFVVLE